MLALHPVCQRCGASLSPSAEAYICSFECTFCPACRREVDGVCPNCEGDLRRRPKRTGKRLERFPASSANGLLPAIPVLSVASDLAAEEFYCGKLGFRTFGEYSPDPERRDPCYRVVVRDGAWIHLNSFPADRLGPGHVYLRVPDVDALETELRAAGVEPVLPATDQSWGTREMVVRDPDGNELHFHRE